MKRPRLEIKIGSDINAQVIDHPDSPPLGISIDGKDFDNLQVDLKDAKRLSDFLLKALAYFEEKYPSKKKKARR